MRYLIGPTSPTHNGRSNQIAKQNRRGNWKNPNKSKIFPKEKKTQREKKNRVIYHLFRGREIKSKWVNFRFEFQPLQPNLIPLSPIFKTLFYKSHHLSSLLPSMLIHFWFSLIPIIIIIIHALLNPYPLIFSHTHFPSLQFQSFIHNHSLPFTASPKNRSSLPSHNPLFSPLFFPCF